MPVRKIPRNYRSVTGKIAGADANSPATASESNLEADLYQILRFDYNVQHFEEQPLRIGFVDNSGKPKTYTPDVLVTFRKDIIPAKEMKPWLCEVKYREDLCRNWDQYKFKFKAALGYANNKGWRFRILTEKEIRTPYLYNAKFLFPYRSLKVESEACQPILTLLCEMRQTDPQSLLLAFSANKWRQAEVLPILWHLVATREIGIDLTLPLTMQSTIWDNRPTPGGDNHLSPGDIL